MARWILAVNGLYTFQDLSPFGFQAHCNNPALEFFLQALPLSYVGADPSNSDSNRSYRQSVVSGFAQDFLRVTSRLTVNVGLRYDFYSNPTEAHGRLSAIRNPATDSGPTVGQAICRDTSWIFYLPRLALRGTSSATVRPCCGAESASFAISSPYPVWCRSVSASLFRHQFLCVSQLSQPTECSPNATDICSRRRLTIRSSRTRCNIISTWNGKSRRVRSSRAGYFGARGNHLPREAEAEPFPTSLGPSLQSELAFTSANGANRCAVFL